MARCLAKIGGTQRHTDSNLIILLRKNKGGGDTQTDVQTRTDAQTDSRVIS
jgi:hypothetical protein